MRLHRPSALLLGAALVLGAVATPTMALADTAGSSTTTPSTPDAVVAALTSAQAATVAAGKNGWTERLRSADPKTSEAENIQLTYAVLQGRGYMFLGGAGAPSMRMIEVQKKGTYESSAMYKAILGANRFQRVLRAVGRPHATWVYEPDKTVDVADAKTGFPSMAPDTLIAELVNPKKTTITGTPTETVAEDGSTTYAFSATDDTAPSGVDAHGTFTVTVDPGGVLTTYHLSAPREVDNGTFAYGAQHIDLPTTSQFVTESMLDRGLPLLTMSTDVRRIANATRQKVGATRHRAAHTLGLVRRTVAVLARQLNHADHERVFTTVHTKHGARVTATNPFTHAKVSYTITAHGKRAVVRRG